MKKIMIWGTGNCCKKFLDKINDVIKQKINIIGYVDNDEKKQGKYYNNSKIYSPNEILGINFDYIIIASEFDGEIEKQILKLGIKSEKIIKGLVYKFKYDFKQCFEYYIKYKNIIENKKFSIVSDSCWGGFLYQKINKEYTSPFVWTKIENNNYIKLLKDLKYYLKQRPKFSRSEKEFDDYHKGRVIGQLGDVIITFPHYATIEEAEQKWNKRLSRFDYENIFVEMSITSEETAKEFNELPFENKIGFTYEEYNLNACVCIQTYPSEFEDENMKDWFGLKFADFNHIFSYKYFDDIAWIANGK